MENWTVKRLREELRARNIHPTTGTKLELLNRLNAADDASLSPLHDSQPSESVDGTPTPSYASWKLTQIRSELRRRQLPVAGNKHILVDRLLQSDLSAGSVSDGSPANKQSSKKPRKSATDPLALNYPEGDVKVFVEQECSRLSIWRHPLRTMWYFLLGLRSNAGQLVSYALQHRSALVLSFLVCFFAAAGYAIQTPYQPFFHRAEELILWYGYWVVLGIASSIGLGTGLHTFVLFLGPHIARIAVTAQECGTTDFAVHGEGAFACDEKDYFVGVSLTSIYVKVMLESFAWGAGTAIGELPPYFVARGAALAGRDDEEIDHIEEIKQKSLKERTKWENVQIFMFSMMQTLGFWGILLSASIPNPLFDLAGITCGHFLIPFTTFFSATFIGKALIKASIQTWFIILLFSKGFLEYLLQTLAKYSTYWHGVVAEALFHQKKKFEMDGKHITHHVQSSVLNVGTVWNGVIAIMIAYFLLSILHSIATAQLRKELLMRQSRS